MDEMELSSKLSLMVSDRVWRMEPPFTLSLAVARPNWFVGSRLTMSGLLEKMAELSSLLRNDGISSEESNELAGGQDQRALTRLDATCTKRCWMNESWLVVGEVRCGYVCRRDAVAVVVEVEVVVEGRFSLGFGSAPSVPSSQLIRWWSNAGMSMARCVREEGNWVESLLGGRTRFLGGSTNRAELGRDVALERG